MSKGTLEVVGTIDVAQFWPTGESDADTASVIVDIKGDSFRFQPHPGASFKVTHFCEGATVRGRQSKPPVSAKGKLTIRLQGIDAPELHYRPAPLSQKEKTGASAAKVAAFKNVNKSYRQLLGATAAKALHDLAGKAGSGTIDCRVFTLVDKPNEVFDTYARFVGDIEITVDHRKTNVNQWLVENGWAFPGFYVSMNDDEITDLRKLADAAKKARRGIWKSYSKKIGAFNFKLLQPKKGETGILPGDKGSVIFPKLFRRQTNWAARNKAKILAGGLQNYLASQPDHCFETDDFLANGASAQQHEFADFVENGKTAKFDPAGLVFSEATSKIVDANGKLITSF